MKPIDLTGNRYGRLVVIERADNDAYGRARWLCKCDCGRETIVQSGNLRTGHTQSCGCLEAENKAAVCTRSVVKHGKTNTRLFHVWQSMLLRCQRHGVGDENYGKRGIKVCDEWQEFNSFYEWSMSHGYDETAPRGQCTIDRIDVNGDYCPENCRWVDNRQQQNNRRDNFYIDYHGKRQTLKQWVDELGVDYNLVHTRLKSLGWSVQEAFETLPGCRRGCSTS